MFAAKLIARAVLLAVFCFSAVSCKEETPQEAANRFFLQVSGGQLQEAWNDASFSFRTRQSYRTFEVAARELGFTKGASLSWERESIEGREAKLEGVVTSITQQKVEVIARLIKEEGKWRIENLINRTGNEEQPVENRFSIVGKDAKLIQGYEQPMPTEAEIQALAKGTLSLFADCIAQQDFTAFHAKCGTELRKAASPERMLRAFSDVVQSKVDLSPVKTVPMTFTEPPAIESDGLLTLNGHVVSGQDLFVTKIRYTYEFPRWRPAAIDFAVRRVSQEQPSPSPSPASPEPTPTVSGTE